MPTPENLNRVTTIGPPALPLGQDGLEDRPETWSQLVEQIVELEELIADLRDDREPLSAMNVRKLSAMLKAKRTLLKAIDVGA
jgi:hypothetical protein